MDIMYMSACNKLYETYADIDLLTYDDIADYVRANGKQDLLIKPENCRPHVLIKLYSGYYTPWFEVHEGDSSRFLVTVNQYRHIKQILEVSGTGSLGIRCNWAETQIL